MRACILCLFAVAALHAALGCPQDPGPSGYQAVVLQTLSVSPPIVRPGCVFQVQAVASVDCAELDVAWSVEKGQVLESEHCLVQLRAPELEELSRLPSGYTVSLQIDAGARGKVLGTTGVVVDRRLGAPCDS